MSKRLSGIDTMVLRYALAIGLLAATVPVVGGTPDEADSEAAGARVRLFEGPGGTGVSVVLGAPQCS